MPPSTPSAPLNRTVAVIAALLSAAVFALYATFAARDVMFGDALELVAAAARDGVAHPPGFPLWIVLAHAASLVPIGTLPFRVNLTAAAFHAVTVGLVYAAGYVLVRRHGPALFAALLLAIGSPLFVTWSLQAEAFSLNDLFAAAIVLLCLLWLDDPRRWRLVVPIGMLFGLGLANHQTLILLVPLPLWAAWCGRNEIEGAKDALRTLCIALVLLLLAFALPYLHVVLASADQAHWKFGMARTPSELIDVIDRHVYGSFRLVTGGILQGGSPAQRVWVLVTLAGWPYLAIVAGLAGLAMRRRYAEIVFAALIVAGPLVAFCALANMSLDQELWRGVFGRFGLLPLVALAPFSAAAAFLLDLVRDARVRTAGCAVVLAAAFVPAAIRLPAMALAGAYGPRVLSRDLFAALPQHAILLATTDAVAWGSTYFQATENLRPDVTVVINGFLPFHLYRNQPWADLTIPSGIGNLAWSNERRDLLARANPSRPFFVANDDFSVRSASSQYTPLGEGLVSHVLPTGTRIDARSHFLYETALQLRPGYADVDANFWRTNGFGSEVRGFYADCFFDTALDAKKLRNRLAAQFWLQRARNYASEPRFDEELRQL